MPAHKSTFTPPSVRTRIRRRRTVALACVLVAALLLLAGFWLGRLAVYGGMGLDPALYLEMQQQLPDERARADRLSQELDVERTRREVDRRSLELVRRDIAAQKEQIAALEEGLQFYRSLMAPGEITQGLSVRDIEIIARAEPGRYAFRIVAQQEALKHQLLKGELRAEIYGTRGGGQVTYSFADLSEDLEEESIPLRFRYFQAVEGEMLLPDGFQPEGINVVASSRTPHKVKVSENYPWLVKERFTHVGK